MSDVYSIYAARLDERDKSGEVRFAVPSDLPVIAEIYRDNRRALGYLPRGAFEGAVATRRVFVYERDGDVLGYLFWGGSLTHSRIFHLCIRQDARRKLHGVRTLLGAFLSTRPLTSRLVTLRCRIDLPATLFWHACGFLPMGFETSSGLGVRPVVRWALPLHVGVAGQQVATAMPMWEAVARSGAGKQVLDAIRLVWGELPEQKYSLLRMLALPEVLRQLEATCSDNTKSLGDKVGS